ncbi:hypothetical protein PICMEDRAFT_168634 [Pichia membranifaciens NRRL Y-2026]|uniref:Uncharacterized protein n=1 Tax=Pichia membranifaciens NRRL Y-2026 TaxID=763406 RepID=A0A1E3NGJ3_9ASCO|nr:hypothetical protein PICMEDRAFT_168634 [Pichia membranifaciens NRRL Y-2026]ODQ45232.1 hypothetical protein PICMEDRAFT_168634 [Pichia membranifaciens NRRL Y-2026]
MATRVPGPPRAAADKQHGPYLRRPRPRPLKAPLAFLGQPSPPELITRKQRLSRGQREKEALGRKKKKSKKACPATIDLMRHQKRRSTQKRVPATIDPLQIECGSIDLRVDRPGSSLGGLNSSERRIYCFSALALGAGKRRSCQR